MLIPGGVWPVMLTPFRPDRSIDWAALDHLVDWYIEAGVAGLFAVCLSSEMYELDDAERLALAERVVQRAAGRVPVLATGSFGSGVAQMAACIRRMAGTGVAAVVCLTNALAGEPEDEKAWRTRAAELLDETGAVALGLYECPAPYKRLLEPETLKWAATTGRFHFLKDTACELPLLEAKLAATQGTPLRLFNADAATLLESLRMGADGFCGISANFVPELWVWLCRNARDESGLADELQAFLRQAEQTFAQHYPASAKHFLSRRGVCLETTCRTGPDTSDATGLGRLAMLLTAAARWRSKLDIL